MNRETVSEYKSRLAALAAGCDPIELLMAAPERLRRFVDRSTGLIDERPFDGKWSIREILAHLADAELIVGYRIRSVLASPGIVIQPFDPDAWAECGRYSVMPVAGSLRRFTELRNWNLDLYSRLEPAEWARCGMHSERGSESVRAMVELYAGHDLNHESQIAAIQAALRR